MSISTIVIPAKAGTPEGWGAGAVGARVCFALLSTGIPAFAGMTRGVTR
jgi:hypothetical protein